MTNNKIILINNKGQMTEKEINSPNDYNNIDISNDIIEVEVTNKDNKYKIYIGNEITIKEASEIKNPILFLDDVYDNIESINDTLCYYIDKNKYIAFAKPTADDIVVKSHDELMYILISIANNNSVEEYKHINKKHEKTKKYHK